MPRLTARVSIPGAKTTKLQALVDTGSGLTLATFGVARMLGLSEDTVRACPAHAICGVGGAGCYAYEWEGDLEILAGPQAMLLAAARIYFTRAALPDNFQLVIGQHDALERLTFVQRNHAPSPEFVLKLP